VKVTLDTMVLWEWLKYHRAAADLEQLVQLHEAGSIELAVTATIRRDVSRDPMAERLESLPEIGVDEVGGVARLGFWRLGRDRLADGRFGEWSAGLESPPGIEDLDHLQAHMLQHRDFFLTTDKAILALADELSQRWGIEVRTPARFLQMFPPSGSSGTENGA